MTTTFTRGNPLHARAYDLACGHLEKLGLVDWRARLVGDLTGEVVELGAGTGKNFPFYSEGVHVRASDFDPVMLRRAAIRASEAAATIELAVVDAQNLPYEDDSVETLVVGLTLCSVPDPDRALSEITRVLKPGGVFRFVEHVRDEPGSVRAKVQDMVNPVWRFLSGGCNANRDTLERVAGAGFEITKAQRFKLGRLHVAPHVFAEATLR